MSHEFPRRRDVRDMCVDVLDALLKNSDDDLMFYRDFLTDVRDLMHDGLSFVDAVLYIREPSTDQVARQDKLTDQSMPWPDPSRNYPS